MRGVLRGCLPAGALLMACVAGAQQGPQIQVGVPQQATAQRAMATVTGHVTCSDTQQPARFATVTLINVEEASGGSGRMGFGGRVSGRTDLDGNFTVQAEPGDYYAMAVATGYVSPVAAAAARLGSDATTAELLAGLPQVHVAENGGGPVNLTIDRGAVISGKLQWDDGSPAGGVSVVAVPVSSSASVSGMAGSGSTDVMRMAMQMGGGLGRGAFEASDDRGVFRLTGLPPGSYWVRATVMTPSAEPGRGGMFGQRFSTVGMYAPGKVRRTDAQTIVLKAGEERDDVAFVMDLSALHTVTGHVSSADGTTVASGMVRLADSEDNTLSRMGSVQADGSFVVQWVPAGTYTLSVTNASTTPAAGYGGRGQASSGGSGASGMRFQSFQESLTVSDGDVSGMTISLATATATQ